ncbi:hypothetical protein Barb4_02779 [Bacteroidales bacterium Barb4]|nr:hypothetical protein Barb4_02779 [Bacteroidales bacterium Barb4]
MPLWSKDSAPHAAKGNNMEKCGVKDNPIRCILKGRPNNIYCIVNHRLQFVSFFQNSIGGIVLVTPHSASAPCGAEISCPFRASANVSS